MQIARIVLATSLATCATGQFAPVSASLIESGFGGGPVLDPGDRFGRACVGIGDLDGDGIPDAVVGARSDDDGGVDAGAFYVLFLRRDGTARTFQKVSALTGGLPAGLLDAGDFFGYSVASVGDVDGDGVQDLVVGAPMDDDGGANTGAAYVINLFTDGTVKSVSKISNLGGGLNGMLSAADRFGEAAGALGDFDGDGIPDVVMGAPGDDDGGNSRGAIWVLLLNAQGTAHTVAKISSTSGGFGTGLANGDSFGGRHAIAIGDLDGDGRSELGVGAFNDNGIGGFHRGALWILSLSAGLQVTSKQKIGEQQGGFTGALDDDDLFGMTVAPVGDVDRDGVPDIVVGSNKDDDGGQDKGALFFLLLNSDGSVKAERKFSDIVGSFPLPLRLGERFGRALGLVGDLRGDGTTTIIVGAGAGPLGGGGAVYLFSFASLAGDVSEVPITGGSQALTLDAGPDQAGKIFYVAGTLSGTAPGVSFGNVHVPLNPDAYTVNPGLVAGYLGVLDATGSSTATFVLPPGVSPSLVGTTLHHAYVTFGSSQLLDFASNAVAVTLQ